jgi:hypothetical protein
MRREAHAEQGRMRERMPPHKPRVLRTVEPMREPMPEMRPLTVSLEEGQRWLAELTARARAHGCLPRWRHKHPTPPREEPSQLPPLECWSTCQRCLERGSAAISQPSSPIISRSGGIAGAWEGSMRARPTVPPRSPVGRRDRGGCADGPSSRIRSHSGGRSWGQHTRWVFGTSGFCVRGADPWRSSVVQR